ncbi:MFS transporter [Planococcus shenhongbingii]|uniref:MFS transporter n=1 Tax=Planococcus shenhongbingii TaxID=3058398 RepID=A0ABT8NBP2_9BACL|nr:MFS transporter [Planococcus sp. N017]MDN7245119.1 MFS transporter [Planococcus sp. N017]
MSSTQRKKISILMITIFITITSFGITGPVIPAYLESINQGGMASGMIIAIFAGAQLLFAPLGGKWTDQFGRRKMIIIGLVMITVGGFLFYSTDTLWMLYASRVISGIGDAFLLPAVFAYTADITTPEQRAKGTGLVTASMSMGLVAGPAIMLFMSDFSIKAPFLMSAFISLGAVLFAIAFLKESDPARTEQANVRNLGDEESLSKKLARSAKMPYFVPLVITFVMSFGLIAYESIFGLVLNDEFNASVQDIAVMCIAIQGVSVLTQLFAVERLIRRFGEVPVLIAFLIVASAGFLLALVAGTYAMFFVVTLIIFMAMSILRPVLNILISKLAKGEVGFAMGLSTSFMGIGNVIGPVSAGMLYDINLVFPFSLGLSMLAVTISITVFWHFSRSKKAALPDAALPLEAESAV